MSNQVSKERYFLRQYRNISKIAEIKTLEAMPAKD